MGQTILRMPIRAPQPFLEVFVHPGSRSLPITYVPALCRDGGKQVSLSRPRLKDLTGYWPHMTKSRIQLDPLLSDLSPLQDGIPWLLSTGKTFTQFSGGPTGLVPLGLQSTPRCPAVAPVPYRPLRSLPLSTQGASTPLCPHAEQSSCF